MPKSSTGSKTFTVPYGKTGKSFVNKLASLFRAYAEGTSLESVAAMIMPSLLLQKPNCSSQAKENATCLDKRLRKWKEGDINSLIIEGRAIQQQLSKHYTTTQDNVHLAWNFSK